MADSRRIPRDWVLPNLEALAVLAGFGAIALMPGVSPGYVLVASALLIIGVNVSAITGWALPDVPARLLNAGAVLLIGAATIHAAQRSAAIPLIGHAIILLLVLRTYQRKRLWDDFVLLVGAIVALGLASFRVQSPLFLPLLLAGTFAAAAGAFRLTVIVEERAPGARSGTVGTEGGGSRWRSLLHGSLLGAKLSLLLLATAAALFVIVPRRQKPEVEEETRAHGSRGIPIPSGGPEAEEVTASARTGFRAEVVLGEIGRIKRDMRIAMLVRIFRDEKPYQLKPEEAYWRGRVHSRYAGRRWSSVGVERIIERGRVEEQDEFLAFEPFPPAEREMVVRLEQEIRLEAMPWTDALFSLYRPFMVHPESESAVRLLPGHVLAMTRPRAERYYYQVQSVANWDGTGDPWDERLSAEEHALHTRLAPLHDRIAELARSIAGDATGVEAGARIRDHLRARCKYTLDLPPLDRERPVEDFLFDARKGHCELFASAMALMLRGVDVPSRLVTGFRGFEWTPDSRWHVVRFSNAHAWVEAFFPGHGWVPLDATPSDEEAIRADPPEPVVAEGALLPESDESSPAIEEARIPWGDRILEFGLDDQRQLVEEARTGLIALEEGVSSIPIVPVLCVLAGLGALALAPRLRRDERKRRGSRSRAAPAGPGGDAVRRAYLSMIDRLARRGVRRDASETPRELADRAVRLLPSTTAPVRGLTGLHEVVCYGERDADREDGRRAAALLAELKQALRHGAS